MSYQEKKTIVSIAMGVLVLAVYCIYAFGKYASGAVDLHNLKFFAVTMLIFIGAGIIAMIVIQIIFHILLSVSIAVRSKIKDDKEIERALDATVVEDEMDKLIELKSDRLGFFITGLGFVAGLFTLTFSCPPAVMLNILFLSAMAGSLAGGFLSLHYYRAGVR